MIQSIPLKKLAPSPRNVRKVSDANADAQLKTDIAARGLLQNLVVRKAAKAHGMQRQVEGYEDEWAATLRDPQRLRRFRPFVNDPDASDDSARQYVLEREQIRPATPEEIAAAESFVMQLTEEF